ncbi:hypothetical protein R1sor_019879 [Riccia sorocarpa]|uniref:DUF4283 domain-containing protein n=1 Tax=Riccia sorocarpa TaxID=122646 RepID=A0ABD3IGH8_9MARC
MLETLRKFQEDQWKSEEQEGGAPQDTQGGDTQPLTSQAPTDSLADAVPSTSQDNPGSSSSRRTYAEMASNTQNNTEKPVPPRKEPSRIDKASVLRGIDALPQPEERTDRAKCIVKKITNEKLEEIGEKLMDLQSTAVILFTGGQNHWRDTMCKWVQEHFVMKLEVTVTRLKVLDKGHYMVVFATEDDRGKVFAAAPFQLNQKHVQISPWSTDYDTNNFKVKLKTVWVSILGLNPLFEKMGKDILQSLGKMLHMTGQDNLGRSKFADVGALVLLNVEMDWPEAVLPETEDGGTSKEYELYYEPVPEGCFHCHSTDHQVKFCPLTTETREMSKQEFEAATKMPNGARSMEMSEDEGETQRDSPKKAPKGRQRSLSSKVVDVNPFSALEEVEMEPEENQNDGEDQRTAFDLNMTAKDASQQGAREPEAKDNILEGEQKEASEEDEEEVVFLSTQNDGTPISGKLWNDGKDTAPINTGTGTETTSIESKISWSGGNAKASARLKAKEAARLAKEAKKQNKSSNRYK